MNFLILLLIVSFNYVEIGLILPVIFPLVMDSTSSFVPEAFRGLFMGCLIGGAATAKFLSLPLLGAWSDRVGRKKAFVTTLFTLCLSALLGLAALFLHSMFLLLFSRILAGIGAGNYAVAQATIADSSEPFEKTKRFALLNSSCGVGYVLGPLLGRLTFISPFTVVLSLCCLNLILVAFLFQSTPVQTKQATRRLFSFNTFRLPKIRSFFIMILCFCLGWGFFCECLPLFLMDHFHFGSKEIGSFYIFSGLIITFCQGIAIRPFANRFHPKQLFVGGLISLACSVPLLLTLHSIWFFYAVLGLIIFFQTLVFPSAATLISNLTAQEEQGEVLGVYQSLQAAGMALGPLLLSSFISFTPTLPIIMGALAPILALMLLLRLQFTSKRDPALRKKSKNPG